MKMKTQEPMGHCKSSAKGKVHSNTGLPQAIQAYLKKLTLHLKQLEKEEMKTSLSPSVDPQPGCPFHTCTGQ